MRNVKNSKHISINHLGCFKVRFWQIGKGFAITLGTYSTLSEAIKARDEYIKNNRQNEYNTGK